MTGKEQYFGKNKRSYTVQEKKMREKEEKDVKKLEQLELYTSSI